MLTTLSTAAAMHWGGPWAGGFPWFFLVIPLFWIAVIVFLAIFIGRRRAAWRSGAYGYGPGYGRGPWGTAAKSAEQTLAERFAQGDIDEVEYRARLEVLRANDTPPQR